MKDFKAFLLRGNVVDLAVAVVVGTAFVAVVAAFIADLITPIVAAIFGQPDFGGLTFTINGSTFAYGHFLNTVIAFLTIATVVYFFVVLPVGKLHARRATADEADTHPCAQCLSVIPRKARRCAFCGSKVRE